MAKIDLSKLQARRLEPEEAKLVVGNADSVQMTTWLTEQFRGLEVGEGTEIGPFATRNDASNFNSYYSRRAADALDWGCNDDGTRKKQLRSKGQVIEKDKQYYLWVVRKS